MKIKILQWNIWYKENIDNIITELKRIDADIVCLQELCVTASDFSNVEKIKDLYPYVYYEIADTFSDNRSQGNAILSKHPFLETFSKFVQEQSENKNDYSKEGRIYLQAKINIEGSFISVGTTHLSYTHKFEETELKDFEIDKLLSYLIPNKDKFIFLGDLNTTKGSKYIKKISNHLRYYNTQNTWTTKPFSYMGFEEQNLNWKLDYVFTSKDLVCNNVSLIETIFSDHLPIIVELDI